MHICGLERFGLKMSTAMSCAFTPSRLQSASSLSKPSSYVGVGPSSAKSSHSAVLLRKSLNPLSSQLAIHGVRSGHRWVERRGCSSRVCTMMSSNTSVGTETLTSAGDALFADYKPTSAFLFPGQVRFI
jgi:hypothetical protein